MNRSIESEVIKQTENIECLNYIGSLTNSEVQDWISKSKLLINTSDAEGFSNTYIEAWANGVPVISHGVDPDDVIKNYGLENVQSKHFL